MEKPVATVVKNAGSHYLLSPLPQWAVLPATLAIYAPGQEPELFLGRGFTGHEHLPWFGLINMNARLYDPLLGRFLSPDPYVQAPDFTQSLNRYSYALNNPLKYTDPSGEFFIIDSFLVGLFTGGWDRACQMAENDLKIWGGLFNVDKNKGGLGGFVELLLRFTWQLPQTILGFFTAHSMNTFRFKGGIESVDYLHGATVLRSADDNWGGMTLSSYIMGDASIRARDDDPLFQHEFGHYLQSQEHGPLWLLTYAIESGISASVNTPEEHDHVYTEQDANARSFKYLAEKYGEEYALKVWNFDRNPIDGYDSSKSYNDNISVLRNTIFSLFLPVSTILDRHNEPHILSPEQPKSDTFIL